MKDNLTEVVFILDRSGSMSNLVLDTIGGYNNLLEKQKNEIGDAFITTILFDNNYEVLHDRIDVKKVQNLGQSDYYVRGTTALYDAIGKTIDYIGYSLSKLDEKSRPSKVLFVIITDGMENSSSLYSRLKVKEMIAHQKEKYSWEFLFLGANLDAKAYAESIGIDPKHAETYDFSGEGIVKNYQVVSEMITDLRKTRKMNYDRLTKIKKGTV